MSYRKRHIKSKIKRRRSAKPLFARPIFWIAVLFLSVALAAGYFLFFYDGLKVKNVLISGNERVLSQDLQDFATGLINEKINNILLVSGEELKKALLERFSNIENVRVNKSFPQTIILEIKERQKFGIFCDILKKSSQDQCYFIDKNGIIFEQVLNIPENSMVLRQLTTDGQVFTGEEVINKKMMDLILKIKNNLIDKFKIDIESALIAGQGRLDVKTTEDWQIYFSIEPDSDIDLEIAKLNSLLAEEIASGERKNLQYIDLRFKDRAYYR